MGQQVGNKRVTLAVSESKNRDKKISQVASTCQEHAQLLIEGGIFSENSHQIRDLLTVISEHDSLTAETDTKHDETVRMSDVILQLQNQLKDAREVEKDLTKENKSMQNLQKQIDAMNTEYQAREKKHDESLRIANNTIAGLEKALNAQIENQNEDKLTGSNLKSEVESLKKTNKNNQHKYEEKAISS